MLWSSKTIPCTLVPRKRVSQALTFHNISRKKNALKLNIAILRNKEDEMVQNNAYLIIKTTHDTWNM
jgi:hypothetical protein